MATQNNNGIEFSLVPEDSRQHFRLLELPPELLSVVTGSNASSLYFKSQDISTDDASGPNNIVLCTDNKTYNVRQVSTSNSLFVAQPSSGSDDSLPQPGLDAIAQCSSTLEVQIDKSVSAVPLLLASLPVYTSTGHHGTGKSRSKRDLFDQLPLSDGECELGWTDLACFELDGIALLPSDSVKLKVWEALLTNATVRGLDLTRPLTIQERNTVVDNDSEWPVELSNAVLNSVSSSASSYRQLEIDGTKLARLIGLCLLKDRTDDGRRSISAEVFQATWADLTPEAWRTHATMSLLEGSVRCENGGADITFVTGGVSQGGASGAASADAKTATGAKRKWHDKFRAAKKAG